MQYTVCTRALCTLGQLDVLVLEMPVAEDEASLTESRGSHELRNHHEVKNEMT